MASMGVMAQMFCDAGDSGTQFTSATPPHPGLDGGFCSIRSLPSACRRRVAPLMVQFPPFGGAVIGRHVTHGSSCSATPPRLMAVRARFGAAPPASQTSSVTNGDNGVSWARWSALWAQWRLAWCVARTRTAEHVR